MSEFGKELANLRSGQNLAIADICGRVSIPQSRLSELERGVRIPTDGQVQRLEAFFGLDPGKLAALVASGN
jgi:transcriptional regulator with XRE-family HTH domain